MAGMERGGRGASMALFAVHFDDEFGERRPPPIEPDRLPIFCPCSLVEGVWELGCGCNGRASQCAFEPATCQSIPRPTNLSCGDGWGGTGDVIDRCGVMSIVSMVNVGILLYHNVCRRLK